MSFSGRSHNGILEICGDLQSICSGVLDISYDGVLGNYSDL